MVTISPVPSVRKNLVSGQFKCEGQMITRSQIPSAQGMSTSTPFKDYMGESPNAGSHLGHNRTNEDRILP